MSAIRPVQIGAEIIDLGANKDVALAIQEDLGSLRTALATLATKLNADGGVTDTNYVGMTAALKTQP